MTEGHTSDREWNLLMGKVDGVAEDIKALRIDVSSLTTQGITQGAAIKALPCTSHTQRIGGLESLVREQTDKIKHRLGWKSLLVAVIPAITAGLMIGSKYL